MEPLLVILIPGLLGGLVLALLILAGGRAPAQNSSTFVPRRLDPPTPELINMAHIRVEGIGGLGMVAAVVAVAIADPRIRAAMIVALVLGTALALCLIVMRRGGAAKYSSGHGPDERSMLRIDGHRRRVHSGRHFVFLGWGWDVLQATRVSAEKMSILRT
jgi:hypothetical protein